MNPIHILRRRREYSRDLKQRRQRLHRVAYSWCQNHALADDLVQETLTKALKKLGQLREPKAMDRWMFDILTNCWRDHLRRHRLRRTEDIDEPEHIEKLIHEDEQERREIVKRVRAAVARLPVSQREVLALVDLEGFSYPEVAEILQIPVGTVTSRLSRARMTLKSYLQDYNLLAKNKIIHLNTRSRSM